jgi:F-type H+-transporting ATPase subunit a
MHDPRSDSPIQHQQPPVPFAMTVAPTALELLVAFLQAYVFAILTCIYLNDALRPGH